MTYFITGATGFIGRHLVPLLLARGDNVFVLVRPGSRARFAAQRERLDPGGKRLHALTGDLTAPGLALSVDDRDQLRGAHVFHLAAIYDLTAEAGATERANVTGTRNLVELANDGPVTLVLTSGEPAWPADAG